MTALDAVSFDVDAGAICALIGPNGAGKTTLFNCLSRLYQPAAGHIELAGDSLLELPAHRVARAGIARTFQNLALFPRMTVLENVMVGGHPRSSVGFLRTALRLPPSRKEEESLRRRARDLLDRLDLGALAEHPAAGLPYGTLKRVELARALTSRPQLLLLDEPASGLNHEEVNHLGGLIDSLRHELSLTVLIVEHHMAMVMEISDRVVVLDFGQKIADGSPAAVRTDPRVVEAYLGMPA